MSGPTTRTLDRNAPLYEGPVPCSVQRNNRDEIRTELMVRVLTGTRKPANGQVQKLLRIELTDDSDAFFLYSLEVSEDEFSDLKTDQSLRVDFPQFPEKFIELLERCVICGSQVQANFIARLRPSPDKSGSVFQILEVNVFKNLMHLSLNMRVGDDAGTKEYLAARLQQVISENEKLSRELGQSQRSLNEKCIEADSLIESHNTIEARHNKELQSLRIENQQAMSQAKQVWLKETENLMKQSRAEVREEKQRNVDELQDLQDRLQRCRAELKESAEARYESECRSRELTARGKSVEAELAELRQYRENARDQLRLHEQRVYDAEKSSSGMQLSVAALEQQVRDKENVIGRLNDLVQKEETFRVYKANNERLQSQLEASIKEINKGNAIIAKQQSERRDTRSKIRLKSAVVKEQERLLEERQKAAAAAASREEALHMEIKKLKENDTEMKQKLEDSTKRLNESKLVLEQNQKVIGCLFS